MKLSRVAHPVFSDHTRDVPAEQVKDWTDQGWSVVKGVSFADDATPTANPVSVAVLDSPDGSTDLNTSTGRVAGGATA